MAKTFTKGEAVRFRRKPGAEWELGTYLESLGQRWHRVSAEKDFRFVARDSEAVFDVRAEVYRVPDGRIEKSEPIAKHGKRMVRLASDTHRRLKVEAARRGVTVSELAEAFIRLELAKEQAPKPRAELTLRKAILQALKGEALVTSQVYVAVLKIKPDAQYPSVVAELKRMRDEKILVRVGLGAAKKYAAASTEL